MFLRESEIEYFLELNVNLFIPNFFKRYRVHWEQMG